ncbi:MAG: sulfatase [Bryobacteraceae bacterium]
MNRRTFLSIGAGAAWLPRAYGAGAKPPNILYIMSDDHSARTVSAYGSTRNKTPNIDRIGREGMRLDNCFCVDSICTPSRAAILTGKYGHMTGVRNLGDRLKADQQTFPQLLHKAGYQTGLVGKYHLSNNDCEDPPQGFDYWNILPGQGRYFDPMMYEMGKEQKYTGYTTDIITDHCLAFLKRRDRSRPFLLLCHHKAPHGLWEYDQKHAGMYSGAMEEPQTFWDDYRNRSKAMARNEYNFHNQAARMDSPNWPTGRLNTEGMDERARKAAAYQKFLRDYLRCVASVDDNVGRLLNYLDEERLARDTIVIYTSDQGAFTGEHGFYDKRLFYEDSIRMPFLVRYPREIRSGTASPAMALNVDFAPTLLDYAGLKAPADMQGRSMRPVLAARTPKDWRRSMFYVYYMHTQLPPHYGVRTQRYKLIAFPQTKEWELFDLKEDPAEMNSVWGDPRYASVQAELTAELAALRKQLKVGDEELPPAHGRGEGGRAQKKKKG